MEYLMNKISFSFVFWFMVVGLVLYIALYIINHYVLPLIELKKNRFTRWWKKFQLVIWALFLSVFFYQSFHENMVITLSFGAIILGIGWNFWRNLFSGLLIQFSEEFKVGDYISTDFATGELTTINLAQSELINDQGELVIIPNHQMRNAVLKHIAKKSNVKTYSFDIRTNNNETTTDIRKLVNHCPYVSSNQKVVVESISQDHFVVKVAIIDGVFLDRVREWFG